MEAMLVRLAIERGGDEWEAELLARAHLLNKLESCDASERLLDEWDQRHQAFHTAIVAGCGSQYLLQMRERLFDLAARYRFIWLRTTVLSVEMLEDKHVQHQTLLDAILARDAETSQRADARALTDPYPDYSTGDGWQAVVILSQALGLIVRLRPGEANLPPQPSLAR
ncbi:CsiR, transcriptional repressor of CsiD [Klebsiella variicola]|uniref:CsiR, transcriptional repressor of CsiD n=1 Tax=Klebsiella variicola TaxID=244366 RepID=A0A7H4ME04_KLEVA|nr:CsiR, transcriptional repressor of CsiD [Klebsiella variicola]